MIDNVVLQRLREEFGDDYESNPLYEKAKLISMAPPVMTKPVKTLSLRKLNMEQGYGCASEFIAAYRNKWQTIGTENTYVNILGKKFACGPEVYCALSTLAWQSMHVNFERSQACAAIFQRVFMTVRDGGITVQTVYKSLHDYKPKDYYERELLKAIRVCLFNENETVLYWVSMCDTLGFYKKALELGSEFIRKEGFDNKSLNKWCKEVYTEAKADKAFMKQLFTPAANKWLIPMLYKLRDEFPEVMNYNLNVSDGFM